MNKKIDNVLGFGEHTHYLIKSKTLCKVFSISIITYRNPFVKEFLRYQNR